MSRVHLSGLRVILPSLLAAFSKLRQRCIKCTAESGSKDAAEISLSLEACEHSETQGEGRSATRDCWTQVNLPFISSLLFTLGFSLLVCTATIGPLRLWSTDSSVIMSRCWAFLCSGSLVVLSFSLALINRRSLGQSIFSSLAPQLRALSFFPWIIIFTSWLTLSYNLLRGPSIRGEILLFGIVAAISIRRSAWLKYIYLLPLITGAGLAIVFLNSADGRLLFSDDHSVFFYRLQLLKKFFPSIPFYNPLWNGGIDARDFFASGAHGVFLLFSPLISIFDLNWFYNFVIIGLNFILLPCSIFASSRIIGLSRPIAAIAATLALSFSRVWFQWSLKYGTLGFVLSTLLLPLVLSLLISLIDRRSESSSRKAIAFFFALSFLLCWTPSGIVLVPAAIIALFYLRTLLSRPWMKIVAVLIPLVHIPWIILFLQVSKVTSFVASNPTASHAFRNSKLTISLDSILKTFSDSAIGSNPLIFFLGVAGLYFIPKASRLVMISTSAFLLFLGTVMVSIKPQLELDRMLIVLTLLLTIPSAATLGKLLGLYYQDAVAIRDSGCRMNRWRCGMLYLSSSINISMIFGILIAGIFSTIAVISNRGLDHFWFKEPEVEKLIKLIRAEPGDGRGLFTGCMLHQLNEGHLAPLAIWTERPLVASSFVHNIWNYQQPIPKNYLARGDAGIEEYFDLYNVDYVFAHEPDWRHRFLGQPDNYQLIGEASHLLLFRRKKVSAGYILEGQANQLQQTLNGITLTPQSKDLVIRFNYLPSLRSSACNLKPREISEGIRFIELTDCPIDSPVKIDMRPVYWRIFNG